MSGEHDANDQRRYEPDDLLQLADDLRMAIQRTKEAGLLVDPSVLETFERTANGLRLAAQGRPVDAGETVPVEIGEAAVDRIRSALVALNARLGLS